MFASYFRSVKNVQSLFVEIINNPLIKYLYLNFLFNKHKFLGCEYI